VVLTASCPAEENATQAVYCGIFVGKLVVFGSNVPFTALESLLSVVGAELEKLSAQSVLKGVLRLTPAPHHNQIVSGTAQRRRRSVLSPHAMVGLAALLVAVLVCTVVVLRCLNEHMYTSPSKSPEKPMTGTTRSSRHSKWPHWTLSVLNWTMGWINSTDNDDATQATTGSRTSTAWFNDATTLPQPRSSPTVHAGHASWTISGPTGPPQKVAVSSRPYHEVGSIYIVEPDDEDDSHVEPEPWHGEYGADPLSLATQWPNHVVDV
jgi:hypothetical protein